MEKYKMAQSQYVGGVALVCALCGTLITHFIGHRWLNGGLDVIEIYYYPLLYGIVLLVTILLIGYLLLSVLRVNVFKRKQNILHWSVQWIILGIGIITFCALFDYTIYYLYPTLPQTFATEYEAHENGHGRLVYNINQLLTEPMFIQYFSKNGVMIFIGALAATLSAHFSVKRNKNVL